MEKIIELISGNPVYQAISVVLILILVYGIMKKIIKLVITIGVLLVLYSIYLNYTDQELPITKEGLKESVSDNVDKAKKKAKSTVEGAFENAKNEIIEKMEKKTDELKNKVDEKILK
tara:strand:+ start:4350 stop:4700 length:351 start_codon:yes stop_codon:yes gene_type:complete